MVERVPVRVPMLRAVRPLQAMRLAVMPMFEVYRLVKVMLMFRQLEQVLRRMRMHRVRLQEQVMLLGVMLNCAVLKPVKHMLMLLQQEPVLMAEKRVHRPMVVSPVRLVRVAMRM